MALVDALAILVDVDNAVGIVAYQIGLHLVGCHYFRLFGGGALGNVNIVGDFVQILRCEYGH
jgi:hypothetical protein